jgi:hypothetical protein
MQNARPRVTAPIVLACSFAASVAVLALTISAPALAETPAGSLHARIDVAVDTLRAGPLSARANDAEFVRRLYLDLTGMIPTAEETRAFLDDPTPNKREALVDRLLASPQYARHMAQVFDVQWMERRNEKHVKTPEWQEFLRQSFAANKPYDQLVREILGADGVDPAHRTPVRFYLDRDGEPNLLTRDVGRLFFGMDLQCAQCHNHPLIDDYLQADYYGLYAFLNRSFVFSDKEKKGFFAEKAEGEVSFKSVFTGFAADGVKPRVPKGTTIAEPTFAKGQEYQVAPAKDVRPVPKFSRRAQLAVVATDGKSAAFNRNIVNRLWAHLMGRGIVHPLDLHHPDNPPCSPALLSLLADDFVAMKYDMKAFLRELALTQTYQRSCEMPTFEQFVPGAAVKRVTELQAEQTKLSAAADASRAAAEKAAKDLEALTPERTKAAAEITKLQTASSTAQQAADKATAELTDMRKGLVAKEEGVTAVSEANAKAQAALKKLPGDTVIAQAAKQLETRTAQLNSELTVAKKALTDKEKQNQTVAGAATAAKQAVVKAEADQKAIRDRAATWEQAVIVANQKAADDKSTAHAVAKLISDAQAVVDYERLAAAAKASQSAADREAAEVAWTGLTDHWTRVFAAASLKPLSPEQLAWSQMQAAGLTNAPRAEAAAKKPATADADKAKEISSPAEQIEKTVYEKLRGNVPQFVTLFGNGPGQPAQDFQPTVNQALFFSNAELVRSWLQPAGDNLTARLGKFSDSTALADELYLSILTRRPTDADRAEVATFLQGRDPDRAIAIQEMAWALLTSTEFRFNH